ncbi:MAG: hypothetical protein JXR70_14695, partial [Spirochaetales bacterium]|nr:hypothetical protein [Spirochaetales bacterium]
ETEKEALEFLTSREMHQMFLNIGTTRWAKTENAAGLFVSMFYKKLVKSQRRAGIKDKYIMDVLMHRLWTT